MKLKKKKIKAFKKLKKSTKKSTKSAKNLSDNENRIIEKSVTQSSSDEDDDDDDDEYSDDMEDYDSEDEHELAELFGSGNGSKFNIIFLSASLLKTFEAFKMDLFHVFKDNCCDPT